MSTPRWNPCPPPPSVCVLGTSKNIAPNRPNLHFQTRMEATSRLYHAGRIRHVIVSGAQNSRYYDEPADMISALITLGVPESAITPDRSGLRTLDSVVRVAEVFGETRYTLITDDFHINRAVFLARHHGHDAIGFSAIRVEPALFQKPVPGNLRPGQSRPRRLPVRYTTARSQRTASPHLSSSLILFMEGKPTSQQCIERLLRHPDKLGDSTGRRRRLSAEGRPGEAVTVLDSAPNPPDSEPELLQCAEIYAQTKPVKAVELLHGWLTMFPNAAVVHLAMADTALRLGDNRGAQAYYERAIQIQPE